MYLIFFYIILLALLSFFFFFQAEDGIRDHCVTGVQTCALPISCPLCTSVKLRRTPDRSGTTSVHESLPGLDTGAAINLKFVAPSLVRIRKRSSRSEERRVGKECRSRWSAYEEQKKESTSSANVQ